MNTAYLSGAGMPSLEFDQIYHALRQIARARLAHARPDPVLQPTVLVHEVLLKLMDGRVAFHDRVHFLATAAQRMRWVLVDCARANLADKRGGGLHITTLGHLEHGQDPRPFDDARYQVLALHQALQRFETLDPRSARAVELCYFGGMTNAEVAAALQVSVATVERDLRIAKSWLRRQLQDDKATAPGDRDGHRA